MRKLQISFITGCFISGVSLAGAPFQSTNNYFNGFYLGAGVGLNEASVDLSKAVVQTYTPSPGQQVIRKWTIKHKLNNYDGMVNILGGYGKTFQEEYYLGAELFFRYSPGTIDKSSTEEREFLIMKTKEEIKRNYSYGAFIRGGYLISPNALFYILAGYNQTHFNVKDFTNASQLNYSTMKAKSIGSFILGIGAEKYLTNELSLRMQYVHAFDQKTTIKYSQKFPQQLYEVSNEYRISEGTLSLDLIYHFT